ncbi:ArsR/SmtB family transcription factor [Phyllobacterium myrsinacearum]|uniref:Transcriptional regulator n=1 Tax=Phyllobacterium myrsinacearum TaxID=28101 RepID=A0A2S9JX20_9HYPH|nr:metalloregulator ArsR/SmtB family transcription factor [Phyllobacterium myrsinacearum]PRD57898.1 transcriptional regulator [Phyllobacterium myrsinacearum]PWV96066.1 DNA-binding transcriptional ArsR family regulator [Phyllobacterium myrsinacearum]RZV09943.1 DNA-binding transcriptional ArsR family regulator [Phyllobacterium myrsinacearum]
MREYRHPQITEVQLESVLYALSDPIRLSIVRQLAREGEATCAALENGRPKSSMSHHFRVLREAGIIKTRNDGTSRINELRDDELAEVFPGLLPAILAVRSKNNVAEWTS